MKPSFMLSLVIIIGVICATMFGMSVFSPLPNQQLSESAAAVALWVCPYKNQLFDSIAAGLNPFRTQISMVFFFCFMLLIAIYMWNLYQNLVKDKFEDKPYESIWFFTKFLFWAMILTPLLLNTPNRYRDVRIRGTTGDWILCDASLPDARPVRSDAVSPRY
jgi:hypothetical protein